MHSCPVEYADALHLLFGFRRVCRVRRRAETLKRPPRNGKWKHATAAKSISIRVYSTTGAVKLRKRAAGCGRKWCARAHNTNIALVLWTAAAGTGNVSVCVFAEIVRLWPYANCDRPYGNWMFGGISRWNYAIFIMNFNVNTLERRGLQNWCYINLWVIVNEILNFILNGVYLC